MAKQHSKLIEENLRAHLDLLLRGHPHREAFTYTILPPGKLLRPKLITALSQDLGPNCKLDPSSNLAWLCTFIEIHHTYTLIHDDLPCMDNDDFRRGRPSLHRAYPEWMALLAGDALLNLSYQCLGQIQSPWLGQLIRWAGKLLGPHGLIQGQILDLTTQQSVPSFQEILSIHCLKTSRLFQMALISTAALCLPDGPKKQKILYDCYQLGAHLGLAFQLLDDWGELSDLVSSKEKKINAFWLYPDAARSALGKSVQKGLEIMRRHQLEGVKSWQFSWPGLNSALQTESSTFPAMGLANLFAQ